MASPSDSPDPWEGDPDLSHIVKGGLKDWLLPAENVKFQSKIFVTFADKKYKLIITNKSLILYAQRRRAIFLKSDDIVIERLDRVLGFEYSESGWMSREAKISIQGTFIDIYGPASKLKPLYHTMESIIKSIKKEKY